MALVKFRTAQGGEVAVRTEDIFVALRSASTPADDTEIWWDGPREVLSSEGLESVRVKLGPGFTQVTAAAIEPFPYLVNRALVTAIIPHPQIPDVCFLQGQAKRLAVQGRLDDLIALIEA